MILKSTWEKVLNISVFPISLPYVSLVKLMVFLVLWKIKEHVFCVPRNVLATEEYKSTIRCDA